jgi:hypothetical protein
VEVCNEIDDDCNGIVDDEITDLGEWYADMDEDGYGDVDMPQQACEQPPGTVVNADDCDDASAEVHPAAIEICNEIDDDCNGLIDDEPTNPSLWYLDVDGDNYGDEDNTVESCGQPEGYVSNAGDCDDLDPNANLDCSPVVVDTVCGGQPYVATGPNTGNPELHVMSAYEPVGTDIFVHITRSNQMTVVLSSYDAANWIVTVDPNVNIDKILLNGYHAQTASVPNNIPLEVRSYDQTVSNFGNWCGYSLPYNGGGCDTNILLTGIQNYTGIDWSSFTGCYSASEFLLE